LTGNTVFTKFRTAERHGEDSIPDNPIYQRLLFGYHSALPYVGGDTLEVGCGEGFGAKLFKSKTTKYVAVDKSDITYNGNFEGVTFIQMTVPYLRGLNDNTFDTVVCFQLIEHIKRDDILVKEIHRVLKPGGKLLLTTPNLRMSLSRNPYHVREYTLEKLRSLLKSEFGTVEMKGVFGDSKVMHYHEQNRASVRKFTRFDIFNFQYILPRFIIRIPYNIFNRMNRLFLTKQDGKLVSEITTNNFFVKEADETCLDFFCIAKKG
jgi:SAM-dependent methyltransferase